ncbi:MAG TPA: hypothetical protein VNX21_06625 [Candidatus Thermoplasmatota archaeon]|nr:hypothetical protein [Candidatus Thermoplasmatota archaeon]
MPEPDAKPPQTQAWGRTGDLVRTFKAVNDPNGPPWSIRFVGAVAAFAILLAGAGAVWWASQSKDDTGAGQFAAATVQDHGDGTFTDYVGLAPASVPTAVDASQVEAALRAWEAAHPGVTILKETPVHSGGQVVGYHVTYRR